MKKMFVIIFLFAFTSNVNAEECTEAQIKELKQKAESIVVDTEFYEKDIEKQKYNSNYIIIQGVPEGFYLLSNDSKYLFEYSKKSNGKIEGIIEKNLTTKKLYIYNNLCPNDSLREITLSLKKYNPYSQTEECKGLEDKIDICKKYYDKSLSEPEFEEKIKEYKENNKVINKIKDSNKFQKNKIIIVIIIIIIVVLITTMIIKNKKNKLD